MSVIHPQYPPQYGNLTLATNATTGHVFTSTGTGSTWTATNTKTTVQNTLNIEGEGADIVINGVRLSDTLRAINDRLAILQIDPKLHSKYDNLRAAYEHYKTLEALLYEENKS